MVKFLNTSGTNYHLEELIKGAQDKLVLISPFLKLNDRTKELLADKNRMKIDVRIVYGKSELAPSEIEWLRSQTFIRTSFCKNLHAKCYMSEEYCIVTSLNLYEFSMVNNNEMGILIVRSEDSAVFREAYEEAQRIVRISEEVRISLERVDTVESFSGSIDSATPNAAVGEAVGNTGVSGDYTSLTTAKLAAKLGVSTSDLLDRFVEAGFLERKGSNFFVTPSGKAVGANWRRGNTSGGYILWPNSTTMPAARCDA